MSDELSFVADVIGVVGATFALLAWLQSRETNKRLEAEKQRKQQRVNVVLRNGAEHITLPVQMRREELSRAELLGRLGMIPVKDQLPTEQKRFSLPYLNTAEFFQQLNNAIEGDGEQSISISCTDMEFDQFDLNKWNRIKKDE